MKEEIQKKISFNKLLLMKEISSLKEKFLLNFFNSIIINVTIPVYFI